MKCGKSEKLMSICTVQPWMPTSLKFQTFSLGYNTRWNTNETHAYMNDHHTEYYQ